MVGRSVLIALLQRCLKKGHDRGCAGALPDSAGFYLAYAERTDRYAACLSAFWYCLSGVRGRNPESGFGRRAERGIFLPIRVYIEDTDAGGIVYYVNYLKYLSVAGPNSCAPWVWIAPRSLKRVGCLSSSLALTYRQPARLDDQLEATADVVAVKGATIRFAQSVKREGRCMVEGDVTIACVDRASGKPRRLSPELKQQLEARMQNKGDHDMTQELS